MWDTLAEFGRDLGTGAAIAAVPTLMLWAILTDRIVTSGRHRDLKDAHEREIGDLKEAHGREVATFRHLLDEMTTARDFWRASTMTAVRGLEVGVRADLPDTKDST